MKKCILLLVSVSTLFGCIINPVPIAEKPPEKINILSKIKPKMEYPYDIEVTKDGKTIYFKNWYNYPKESDTYLDKKILEQNEILIKRRVIYKLDLETKKIELFKIGDDPLIYNELGNDMEIDDEDNLYVNVFPVGKKESYIYKISPKGNLLKTYSILETENKPHAISVVVTPNTLYEYIGPTNLYLKDNTIFYTMFKTDEELYSERSILIKKLDLKNNINTQISIETVDKPYNFIIENNILSRISNAFDLNITENNKTTFYSFFQNSINKIRSISKKDSIEYYIRNNSIKINSKKEIYLTGLDVINKYDLNSKKIVTIGNYVSTLKDGNSEEASFDYPSSLSIDKNDNIYVADTGNNAIRKITPDGIVTTLYKEL
jgi:hypothetical protein